MAGAFGREAGKLRWAGEAWATGGLGGGNDAAEAEDLAFWSLPAEAFGEIDDTPGVWPQNILAVRAWLAVDTQLRLGPGGVVGLDYAGAQAGLALAGISLTPAEWADVQIIEAAAVDALNRTLQ